MAQGLLTDPLKRGPGLRVRFEEQAHAYVGCGAPPGQADPRALHAVERLRLADEDPFERPAAQQRALAVPGVDEDLGEPHACRSWATSHHSASSTQTASTAMTAGHHQPSPRHR